MGPEDDEKARRQNEINMFAALASGDFDDTFDVGGAGSFNAGTMNRITEEDSSSDEEGDEENRDAQKTDDPMRNMFSQAANSADTDSSGTFKIFAPTSDSGRLNLEAAAAALEDDDAQNIQPQNPAATENTLVGTGAPPTMPSFNKQQNKTPMHTQEVRLSRPLFFGCRLPPRVVEESRIIVKEAMQQPERISPQIRNLLSVIRTYGNGVSILPGEEGREPTQLVSVFCPQWSEKPEEKSKAPFRAEFGGDDSSLILETTTDPLTTEASHDDPAPSTTDPAALSERDMFSMWAQGDYDNGSTGNMSASSNHSAGSTQGKPAIQREPSLGSVFPEQAQPVPMSDQDLFSLWARGESTSNNDSYTLRESMNNSMRFNGGSVVATPTKKDFFNATFMNTDEDSDEDSVVGSELKKKVGANEHLNAALASLEEEFVPGGHNDTIGAAGAMEEAMGPAQVPLTPDGTRALTNHELMNGCTPLFGVDDSPLPVEGDLGIHETRDEQQRSREQRRNQAIIESFCAPNIFSPIACPDPALSPDDNHSWNSIEIASQPLRGMHSSVASMGAHHNIRNARTPKAKSKSPNYEKAEGKMASPSPSKSSSVKGSLPFQNRKFDSKSRFGWWNLHPSDEADEEPDKSKGNGNNSTDEVKYNVKMSSDAFAEEEVPYLLPPWEHSANAVLVQTELEPTPEQLYKQNRSLSHLHPATSLAQSLPFLSDRPPSYRYLQIDTQAVGFPTIGGEIEALFCSLAIYHVETIPHGRDGGSAPLPDLQRCGKITETLNFDVVSDRQVESRCGGAVWPYKTGNSTDQLQGTRCGVFPLPSNLNIHNLYAILTVSKVVSDSSDFEVYLRGTKSGDNKDKVDIELLRSKAEKASSRQGKFLMPFAFGVAPLLQVFGADVPVVPSSRAVQIPLFRFSSGQGERQIIDHIMVMLYPKANHKSSGIGGAAPVTNGGSAMLVMRNFGYLGLHSVIHSKSSLARDRLVDFTREIQIRRKRVDEDAVGLNTNKRGKVDDTVQKLPDWHRSFVAEATTNGGRNLWNSGAGRGDSVGISDSELYAQELAALPLQSSSLSKHLSPSGPSAKGLRDRPTSASGDDIEPYFHTVFCNHMLVHPRQLHNCPKGNIVIKVELRDMEWSAEYNAYFAHLPRNGPSCHNPRRGPFLVQSAFTSCSSRCSDPRFLDEFKLNLPLLLELRKTGQISFIPSVLFTVYRLSFSSRKKWGKRNRANKRTNRKVEEIADSLYGEGSDEIEPNRTCQLIQLGCGFIPLASNFSLLPNGSHDIRIKYTARNSRREYCEKGHLSENTLIISESIEAVRWSFQQEKSDAEIVEEDAESVGSSLPLPDTASATSASDSIAMSETTEDRRQRHSRQKSGSDPMSLQVKIFVQSSVHTQNTTLSEFLSQESDLPSSAEVKALDISPLLGLSREEIYLQSNSLQPSNKSAYDADKLLISTIDISKPSLCSVSDISCHLLRVVSHLWKIIISGVGEPDVTWANPASIIPLRIQAFASLLQILGTSTIYLSKRGVTQLDGSHTWNLIALSRVMAILFDEGSLFGSQADEPVVKEFFRRPGKAASDEDTGQIQRNPKEKRRRHVRSTFEFYSNGDGLKGMAEGSGNVSKEDEVISTSPVAETDAAFKSNLMVSKWGDVDDDIVLTDVSLPGSQLKADMDGLKIDSVTDFRSALKMGTREVEDDDSTYDKPTSSGEMAAMAMINAYSGPSTGGRWKTAPVFGLATINEDGDGDGDDPEPDLSKVGLFQPRKRQGPLDGLDAEQDYVNSSKGSVKQMRVPRRRNDIGVSKDDGSSPLKDDQTFEMVSKESESSNLMTKESESSNLMNGNREDGSGADQSIPFSSSKRRPETASKHKHRKTRSQTLPTTDAEIATAGASFLDTIEKSLGLSNFDKGTEKESRVGHAHHRKSTSKFCSIDWSIPNDDLSNLFGDTSADELQTRQESAVVEIDDSMSTLKDEKSNCTKIPNFVDRLLALGRAEKGNERWFPFAYEVIIMQWAAILSTQRASEGNAESGTQYPDVDGCLSESASRTSGVVIACAPVLFEIIKQSLGWRIQYLFKSIKSDGDTFKKYPALVTLDDTMQTSLEQVVGMITDACLDSRNFDSWDTRQTCLDVNDSIIWFLRDLFAFLNPDAVHRLIMIYLTRLAANDSKNLQDRDSSIGLRCSWEVTKLQMNAITALIRFPDFMKVNSPQMNNLGALVSTSTLSTVNLFDSLLLRYQTYKVRFDSSNSDIVPMKPHWLAEIVVDICLLGTEHAEQNIQRRAASLLHELFWEQSQQSMRDSNSSIVASVFITFLEKVLTRVSFLSSCFAPKSQVRQDIVRCVTFVLQSAPSLLLRALWRRLCARAAGRSGRSMQDRFGGIGYSVITEATDDAMFHENQKRLPSRTDIDVQHEPDIFDMFSLLNLCLASLEYEGSDDHTEMDGTGDNDGQSLVWRKDVLLGREQETTDIIRRRRIMAAYGRPTEENSEQPVDAEYSTSCARKWISHDGTIVVTKAAQQIVRELRFVLEPSEEAQSFFNPARRKVQMNKKHKYQSSFTSLGSRESRISFSYMDTVIFVRASTSVLLHALTLRQSDIAIVKILAAAVEVIKIFGIKIFNEAVGETLQHWMRVVSFHCGSRRAEVRVPASDFLELILRSMWDSFGSFFRIRLPLLAVQTEVMERIVATAAARHYREQRKMGLGIDLFSNGSAEASLAPLWRTLDRLHHQSASQNVAFRSALIRMAEKLKKLFRAYIAAHALSFLNRSRSPGSPGQEHDSEGVQERNLEAETLVRAGRISVHRVINATAGYSKQFLGLYSISASEQSSTGNVAHHEAVEDAFLDAADVFSPTELPDHRVAWLRKLAEFHATRSRYAEEASCHYHIHVTLSQASRLHGALWSSTPFLPWTDNNSDGIHLDGEGPAGEPDDSANFDELPDEEIDYGRQIDRTNSFRRIFYRNENSIRINGGELEAGSSKYAFCGVTLASEYHTVTPWISLREMEATLLEEAEAAGDLFLKSGIVASSRFAWGLATRHYAEKFCYGKLAHVYERLARTVVSQVPPIDSTLNEVCVSVPLGRFYRVWFHGGAPDELIGAEFVYRSAFNVKLDQFGKELKEVIRCIIPDNTPIHLVLDGRPEESIQQQYSAGFSRMAGAPLEPVRIKVTPLRPMVRKSSRFRGLPEWFDDYIDTAFSGQAAGSNVLSGQGLRSRGSIYGDGNSSDALPHHRDHSRSYSASMFSSSATSTSGLGSKVSAFGNTDSRRFHTDLSYEGELLGADKFSFMQPINKDRSRGTRDWLKGASGDFSEKTLRVTQLQVGQAFPACVSRQTVIHRIVFTQSPLEAAVDAICQWCSILFRTAVATNGMALLGTNFDPGIGIDAAKVVSDCIHSSRVKEMGLYLLKKNTDVEEEEDGDVIQRFDRLGEDEVKKLQLKLARSLIVFMELLHLLIARNRDLLLDVIQERKKDPTIQGQSRSHHARGDISVGTITSDGRSTRSFPVRQSSMGAHESVSSQDGRSRDDQASRASHRRIRSTTSGAGAEDTSISGTMGSFVGTDRQRTDSAIGIQSELQRAFISLSKDLHPMILGITGNDTPRWLKQCCSENYFSAYTYRSTKIPMGEELAFEDINASTVMPRRNSSAGPSVSAKSAISGGTSVATPLPPHSIRTPGSPGGSLGSGSAVSRGSDAARSVKSIRSHKSNPKI